MIILCFFSQALTAIFSWNGFKSQQHHELFKTGLVRLAQDSDATEASSDMTVDELAAECCKYLVSIEEHILHLASAQSLVSFYQALAKHLNEETTNEALGKSHDYLSDGLEFCKVFMHFM